MRGVHWLMGAFSESVGEAASQGRAEASRVGWWEE